MAESTQQVERVARRGNPHLQPLDPRPVRHVHHGQTGAMWAGTMILLVAFVVGGVAMVIGPNWPLFIAACALGAVGIIVGLVMQALGLGIYTKKNSG